MVLTKSNEHGGKFDGIDQKRADHVHEIVGGGLSCASGNVVSNANPHTLIHTAWAQRRHDATAAAMKKKITKRDHPLRSGYPVPYRGWDVEISLTAFSLHES